MRVCGAVCVSLGQCLRGFALWGGVVVLQAGRVISGWGLYMQYYYRGLSFLLAGFQDRSVGLFRIGFVGNLWCVLKELCEAVVFLG
jgi:hypothetical protein